MLTVASRSFVVFQAAFRRANIFPSHMFEEAFPCRLLVYSFEMRFRDRGAVNRRSVVFPSHDR